MKRALVFMLAACIPGPIDLQGKTCASDDDCAGLSCVGGTCGGMSNPVDAGTDAGTPDPCPRHSGNLQFNPELNASYGATPQGWEIVVIGRKPDGGYYELDAGLFFTEDGGPGHETALHLERFVDIAQPVVVQPTFAEWFPPGYAGTLCSSTCVRASGTPLNPSLTLSYQFSDGGMYGKGDKTTSLVSSAWKQLRFSTRIPDGGYDAVFPAVAVANGPGSPLLVDDIEVWQGHADGGCD